MKLTPTQQKVLDQLSHDEFRSAKEIRRRSNPLVSLYKQGLLIVKPVSGARTAPLDPKNPNPGVDIYTHPREDLLWKLRAR